MPAGELFDLIRPVVLFVSALVSALVLASARKRFSLVVAFGWAFGTLLLPLVALPLYLAVILLWSRPARSHRRHLLLSLAYGFIVTMGLALYFYRDNQSVDAHLARATQAKLVDDHVTAIREYRRALAIENDAHIHKLLAVELAQTGDLNGASVEYRLAQQGGEPDSH
jgi:hypothetical protein